MTSHYLDIRVVPDPETTAPQLLDALYDRLHLALVQQRRNDLGVSFPGYSITPRAMGTVLRLHGQADTLHQFMRQDWLKGLRGHVRLSEVTPVPDGANHRCVHRRQFKTSAERLRRRRMRRKGETAEQAQQAIPLTVERRPDLPYLHLRSRSTGQPSFCLFVALGPLQQTATTGMFNSHGLSSSSTIPWF